MNSCDHKPQFKWSAIFARISQYTCCNCSEKLQMTKTFQTIARIMNGVLIAALFLVAITSGKGNVAGATGWSRMAIDVGIMIGIVVLYLLLQILLFRFAKYELVPAPEEKDIPEEKNSEGTVQKPEYTPEQVEIMEMYAAAERQALIDAGKDPDIIKKTVEKIEESVTDTCAHIPTGTWKNYLPSKCDFVCEKCGKPIAFTPAIKKNINMLLLVITILILMPNFINANVDFWKFGLLSLLVLVIAIAIQFFFVKKGHFVLKDPNEQKR